MFPGDNARVKYQIINGDDHGQFEINADTGVIRVSGRLDRETLSYYNLAVRATDQSHTHHLSTTVMVSEAYLTGLTFPLMRVVYYFSDTVMSAYIWTPINPQNYFLYVFGHM